MKPNKAIGAKRRQSKQNGFSKPKSQNGAKSKSLKDQNGSDDFKISKKPSKLQLKSIIESLKKDPDLLAVRRALKYVSYYLKSEGLTKKLLKEIIRLWAESSEKIRVVCLLCLIRIYTKLNDTERRQVIIKSLYTTFLSKCGIAKFETMSMISFMRHTLVELYKIDPQIAYKQSQTACQQLSSTLQNATNHKNEETYKSVLNWRFANCLILLSQLIASQTDESPVRKLTQQVIELNIGAINLLTSPRYYPYYCHLTENLIHLSISARVFIPILPLLLNILKRLSFPRAEKVEKTDDGSESEYNIELLNHVSLDEAHTIGYQTAVLNKVYELLVFYLANQCHKIAFPELVFLPCVQIKKWLRSNPGQSTQKFKVMLDKIKSDCEINDQARKNIEFSFTNYNAVDAWEKKLRDSNKMSLPKLYQSIKHDDETRQL